MLNICYAELWEAWQIYVYSESDIHRSSLRRHCMRTALGTSDLHLRPSSICIKILRVAWEKKKKERLPVNILMSLRAYEHSRRGCAANGKKCLCLKSSLNWIQNSLHKVSIEVRDTFETILSWQFARPSDHFLRLRGDYRVFPSAYRAGRNFTI